MFKKLKRRLTRRRRGGFTLVEVIVASALLGILLLGIMMFVSPVMKMLNTEQQAGRGNIVATTIHQYLTRTIRNTSAIKIYTGADKDNLYNIENDPDFQKIISWLKDGSNAKNYELRCLAIHPEYNSHLDQKSNLLYQEYLNNQDGTSIAFVDTSETLVFNECFYGGLFPEITIGPADEKYVYVTAEQTLSATVAPEDRIPGVEFRINMYDEDSLDPNSQVYSGYGLIELYNISSSLDSDASKIFDNEPLTDGEDTLIFYLARKINITTTP